MITNKEPIFTVTDIDLGTIQENTKHQISFFFEGPIKLLALQASCGCSVPELHYNKIMVRYNSQEVPAHLIQLDVDHYNTTKRILVTYEGYDGTERVKELTFKAIVKTNRVNKR